MFYVKDVQTGRLKFTGRAKAVVKDIKDPQQKGRIVVTHPLLGDTAWIPYLQLPFAFDLPSPGDVVFVECDGGFAEHPVAWGKIVGDAGTTPIPDCFKRPIPSNRGMYTPGGHLVELDDGVGPVPELAVGKGIKFTSAAGSMIHITDDLLTDDKIIIEKSSGAKIEIDATSDDINITNALGEGLLLSASGGITLKNATGNTIKFFSGNLTLDNVAGDEIKLSGGTLSIQNATGDKVLLEPASITVETSTAEKVTLTGGEIIAENAAGATMKLGPTEASILNSVGAGMKADANTVAVGGPSAELVDVLETFLTEISTDVFAGQGAPAGKAALYATLAAKLKTIKGSL